MKKISVSICVHLWIIFLFLSINAQEFKIVQDGIEYAEMTRTIDNVPVKMNLLRLDLTKVRLDVVHAMDSAIGTETVSSMATRNGAFAAINAGFFRLDKSIFAGDSQGILVIDSKVWSEAYGNRIALFINNLNKNETLISFHQVPFSYVLDVKNSSMIEISGVNRQRQDNEIILYEPEFHRTTLTNNDGVEFIIEKDKVKKIIDGKGSNLIPVKGVILSASGTKREELLRLIKVGSKIDLMYFPKFFKDLIYSDMNHKLFGDFINSEDIIGGVPQLIKNGKIEITWEEEKASKSFVETKHPRTAVAKLKDGKFLMITVDGRSETSGGIGLEDLAKLLLEFGATDAMNLDGGGSTTMFLNGKVVNQPSDKEGERKVGDAILVSLRNQK